jgi:hypothetical protein
VKEGAFSAIDIALGPFRRNVVLHGLFPNAISAMMRRSECVTPQGRRTIPLSVRRCAAK